MTSTKRRDTIPGTPSSIRATRLSEVRGKAIHTSYESPPPEANRPPEALNVADRNDDDDERITLPVPAAPPVRRPDPRREED
jgi:hypothetical protein